jgi:hypothetical protein
MQHGDNWKRGGFRPVNDDVVGIKRESPERQRTAGSVGTDVAALGSPGYKPTGVIDSPSTRLALSWLSSAKDQISKMSALASGRA